MKKRVTNLILAAGWAGVMLIVIPVMCFAGAWTQEKGASYHQFTLNCYYADRYFDDDGHDQTMADQGEFRDIHVSYYGEYGLGERLTVLTSLSFKYLKFEDNTVESDSYGVSDIDLGLKYKLVDSPLGIVSVQGLVKIPEAYDEDDAVPLGNGQYDLECRLLYGKSLYPFIPGYMNLEAGYRWRADFPADEFRYLAEFGVNVTSKIYGRMKLDGICSMGNSDTLDAAGNNPSVTPEFDLGKLDLAVGYKVTESCLVEVGFRPEIYGQNTSKGNNASVSVAFKR
ncbi:MAG: hypothetical protein KKD44_20400 [Proteobacteria bacterium]|nr:hypothetical protein [Pseudomonadota bacterium]